MSTHNYGDRAQSDLNNPDRVVSTDDTFKYNYKLNTEQWCIYSNSLNIERWTLSGGAGGTNYQRDACIRMEHLKIILMESEELDFTTYDLRGAWPIK